jgi:hypothetical protein
VKKEIQIPFGKDGNPLVYAREGQYNLEKWVPNYTFDDVLTIDGITRGRSAAQFNLSGSDGRKYTMFMTDMFDVIKRADIHRGMIAGTWTFQKRGQNYGVRLLKEKD